MVAQGMFIALIQGISLLALIAIAFGVVERQAWPRYVRSVIQGLIFGIGAVVAIMTPARLGMGAMVDSRGIIVGFAAAFGGWPAALVAIVIGAGYRLWLGGMAAIPGAVGIVMAGLLGLSWRYFLRPKSSVRARHLVVLGLVVSCYLLTGIGMGYASFWALITLIGPYMASTSVAGAVLLGLFVERELRQIEREQQWKMRALTDPLTGLPNRRGFERGVEGLRTPDTQSALMAIDLDHFKTVNDTYGHGAGDYVLQKVSMVLRSSLRNRDLLSRLGGEELAVLLPEADRALAQLIGERLRRAIDEMEILWEGKSIHVTASFGIAIAPGTLPMVELFERADAALYSAKHSGRNRVVFAGDEPLMAENLVMIDPSPKPFFERRLPRDKPHAA